MFSHEDPVIEYLVIACPIQAHAPWHPTDAHFPHLPGRRMLSWCASSSYRIERPPQRCNTRESTTMVTTTRTIVEEYTCRRPRSAELHARAARVLPNGVTHDKRWLRPYPAYITDAHGAYKRDVDGNQLIDFVMGHGALLLGHGHPAVTEAVARQLPLGSHLGGSHELEIEWAEAVTRLMPSVEKVRFTSSGTEATQMAIRLARAHTGRSKLLKLHGHFHGWHDAVTKTQAPPYDRHSVPGVPKAVSDQTLSVPADVEAVEDALRRDPEIAALILEPSGAGYAAVPLPEGFLAAARELTSRYGALLIFDEVVTGFRWAPGGAQERYGIHPDLTTLAKILAGGLSGGAVAGPNVVMDLLEHTEDAARDADRRVVHQGTFNANPLSAAAGVACLRVVADEAPGAIAQNLAVRLRIGINERLERLNVPGCAWGDSSICHLLLGDAVGNRAAGDLLRPDLPPEILKTKGSNRRLAWLLGLAMANEGVDLFAGSAIVSAVHTKRDIDHTLDAFERCVHRLRAEGEVAER